MVRKNDAKKDIVPFTYPLDLFDVWGELEREMWDSWKPFPETGKIPGVEIYEEKGRLILKTELPGIAKKDLDISLEGGMLTIKAETKGEGAGGKKKGSVKRHYNRYFPAVTLPVGYAPGISHRQGNPSPGLVLDKHGYEERGCFLLAGNL